jgi:hypothetical protein
MLLQTACDIVEDRSHATAADADDVEAADVDAVQDLVVADLLPDEGAELDSAEPGNRRRVQRAVLQYVLGWALRHANRYARSELIRLSCHYNGIDAAFADPTRTLVGRVRVALRALQLDAAGVTAARHASGMLDAIVRDSMARAGSPDACVLAQSHLFDAFENAAAQLRVLGPQSHITTLGRDGVQHAVFEVLQSNAVTEAVRTCASLVPLDDDAPAVGTAAVLIALLVGLNAVARGTIRSFNREERQRNRDKIVALRTRLLVLSASSPGRPGKRVRVK